MELKWIDMELKRLDMELELKGWIWSRKDGYGVERIDMELKDWGWS